MKKFMLVVASILGLLLIWLILVMLPLSGALQKLKPLLAGSCTRIDIFPGTEDVAIDRTTNTVFVSATNRRGSDNEKTGGIFAFNLDNPNVVTRISPLQMTDFQPHGISLWHGEDGETRLFAINHLLSGKDVVEIFTVGGDGMLTHLDRIAFAQMFSPNDLHAVGPKQFYATNDKGHKDGILYILEQYFALPLASAVYYDGTKGEYIKKGLVYSNGINASPDGKTIYISEFLKRRISVFDRDIESGALTKRSAIKLNTAPDNIDIDLNGDLWVGGHSKVFEFLAHAKDESNTAPSHIIKIDHKTGKTEDVFISTQGEINGSSVGAVHNNKLVIGAVFDGHVLVCPLP
ncbi:MAG: SMP-30/gluconolactonase/LRE family protein [Robiginitomaculum sp.]|nr:SMP-30/gluconolactonase/LRE family protein [Robiginitomaculum sp.]